MGVDTQALLPGNCRIGNVANVLGKLYGCTHRWIESSGARWIEVDGVEYKISGTCVEMAIIDIREVATCTHCDAKSGKPLAHLMYFFESSNACTRGNASMRTIHFGSSRAKKIAVAKKLVDFFGGIVVYADCEPDEVYEFPTKSDLANAAQDGDEWDSLQERMAAVVAVTPEEIEACEQYAAYKKDE